MKKKSFSLVVPTIYLLVLFLITLGVYFTSKYYGYYDEITSGDMRDYDEMNRYCDEKDLNDIDFYRGKLGWDTEIWNLNNIYFKAGEYLKNSYPKLYNYSHRR